MKLDIVTAPRRDSKRWTAGVITWDEIIGWMAHPARVKECGGYVLGTLRGDTRSKTTIVSRSALTLDADTPNVDLPTQIELLTPYAAIIHTTFQATPEEPRYRIIMQLDRSVLPDEYHALATIVMDLLGAHQFDPGSAQPERYMYKPSAKRIEDFRHWVIEGDPVPVDELLAGYEPDLSIQSTPKPGHTKRDPFDIEGTIGAFNRAYPDIADVVLAYDLPYEPASDGERWQLVGTRSVAGVNVVAPGLVFSHHVTDPAYGQTCSSFDLVRLHRFGELDLEATTGTPVNRLPSHLAMLELAAQDPKVIADLVGVDFNAEMDELLATDWKMKLRLQPRSGRMVDDINNWDLVRLNDPAFSGLYFNEFSLTVETDVDFPWRPISRGGPVVSATDRAALCHYIERQYRLRPARSLVDELVNTTAQQRYVNPVRDYLNGLTWDGKPRVETCLPGVRPTAYTRMVARKSLTAAVARALDPGCKWDHTLVLYGPEGLGKSWWIDKMARGYSASLGRIGDKDTLLTMQRSWIMLSDEGFSLRKADADVQKEFLTRTADVFRMPYDREAIAHPRHCVIWATTNDEVFLRRQEGNRRFLIVRCVDRVDFDTLTSDYVDQVWAEAVHFYREGEELFLTDEQTELAADEREGFTEEDALAGLVEEYLNTPVPETWGEMSPEARRMWMSSRADGLVPEGTQQQMETCSAQLWVEALGNRIGQHNRNDLLQLNTVLKKLPGWTPAGRQRLPHYGPQLVFRRTESSGGDLGDLV